MLRALFQKTGNAVYISHLDLMRLFQRAFKRAGLPLTHTQGFNPRPSVSIALPLSLGVESQCELLDFEVTQETDGRGIAEKLNEGMPEGLHVLDCYEAKRPVRELAALRAEVTLEYDSGIPENAAQRLQELLSRREIIIQKRTKRKDMADVDIAPMILRTDWREGENALIGTVLVQAQNPGLNPQLLEKAVERYAPELAPDFTRVRRLELLDAEGKIFR
mgnify:CR=1 FL=1